MIFIKSISSIKKLIDKERWEYFDNNTMCRQLFLGTFSEEEYKEYFEKISKEIESINCNLESKLTREIYPFYELFIVQYRDNYPEKQKALQNL